MPTTNVACPICGPLPGEEEFGVESETASPPSGSGGDAGETLTAAIRSELRDETVDDTRDETR